jgi:hypothetical protein
MEGKRTRGRGPGSQDRPGGRDLQQRERDQSANHQIISVG